MRYLVIQWYALVLSFCPFSSSSRHRKFEGRFSVCHIQACGSGAIGAWWPGARRFPCSWMLAIRCHCLIGCGPVGALLPFVSVAFSCHSISLVFPSHARSQHDYCYSADRILFLCSGPCCPLQLWLCFSFLCWCGFLPLHLHSACS